MFVNFSHSKDGLTTTPAVPVSDPLHFGSPVVTWRTPLRILRRLQAASSCWIRNHKHMGAKQLLITSLFSIELAVDWHKTLDH